MAGHNALNATSRILLRRRANSTFSRLNAASHRSYATVSREDLYSTTVPNLAVKPDSRVLVTGFTGKASTIHSEIAIRFGTNIVGGVSPKKGGTTHLGKPVFSTVQEAVSQVEPEVVLVFVPPLLAAEAILDAVSNEVPLVVAVAEGIPAHEQMRIYQTLRKQDKSRLVGANCPGLMNARGCKLGIQPVHVHTPGKIGIAGRSGTLTYECASATSAAGLGQTYVIGLGGDLFPGTTTLEALQFLLDDPETEGIILAGEIGGDMEIQVAKWLKQNPKQAQSKPIAAMIVGRAAPKNRIMGHAGSYWELPEETADYKRKLLAEAGVAILNTPEQLARNLKDRVR